MVLLSIFSAGKHKSRGSFENKTCMLIVITHHNDVVGIEYWSSLITSHLGYTSFQSILHA